jgi:predicted ATP-grasp superfamily ATP-dependent carboligase
MELFEDPRLTAAAGRLIHASDYSGWGLVEFKRCLRRDTYVLMEINPKFWASIELVLRTQPAFAKLLLGLSVPAERITKLWWPGRLAMMGIDYWPKHLAAIRGARVA